MRTLQEKYNAINEGKFTKEQFLRDARMEQPNLVTRFNGYNDAVQILKNRGMISEVEYSKVLELPDGNYFAIDSDWEDTYKGHNGLFFTIDGNNIYDKDGESIQSSPREFLSQFKPEEILKVEEDIERVKQELERRKGQVKEISSDLFKRTIDVARGRDEDKRVSDLGSTFFNSFKGKPLLGGTIVNIETQKPSQADYFDVIVQLSVPTQKEDGSSFDKTTYIYYDVDRDDWNMKGREYFITRQDARMLSQIATKINPDSKYRQPAAHFDIQGTQYGGKLYGGLREATQPKLTKKALADYRYKPTNEMDKYPYEQILRGLRVELETMGVVATPTAEEYQKALAKVLKNLEKDSIYYTNQVAGVKPTKKRTDVMIDATAKNEVDKENGLQKAQLKEAFKKIIKNILSEGNEFGEGEEVYEMYSDSDGDYEHDKDTAAQAEMLYDKGQELFNRGKKREAEALRQQALEKASWLGWGDTDLPPYKTPEIPGFEGTRDALDNLFETGREGMDEGYDEDKIAKFEKYTYTLDGKVVKPEIAFFGHILGAELDGEVYKIGIPDETGTVELRSHKGKTGMYTEDIFESVSLKDILD